jgi:hypothetical protein
MIAGWGLQKKVWSRTKYEGAFILVALRTTDLEDQPQQTMDHPSQLLRFDSSAKHQLLVTSEYQSDKRPRGRKNSDTTTGTSQNRASQKD